MGDGWNVVNLSDFWMVQNPSCIALTSGFYVSPTIFNPDTDPDLRIHKLLRATGDQRGNNPQEKK